MTQKNTITTIKEETDLFLRYHPSALSLLHAVGLAVQEVREYDSPAFQEIDIESMVISVSLIDFSERLHVRSSTVRYTFKSLERHGLMVIKPQNMRDQVSGTIALTACGMEKLELLSPDWKTREVDALSIDDIVKKCWENE